MVQINCIHEYLHTMYIAYIIISDTLWLENDQELFEKSAKLNFIILILGSIVIRHNFESIVIIFGSIVIILRSIITNIGLI